MPDPAAPPAPSRLLAHPEALTLGIAAAAAALRLAALSGLELYADEAYYWLWSLRPAAGYFDHPPMVAWVATLGRWLPGELGLRLPFALLGGLAVWLAGRIAGELSGHPLARPLGALLAACAPLLELTGAMVLPDAPVQAAYAAGTWLLARARGRGWLAAGAAVGLALLSKYTAGLLAPGLAVAAVWDPEMRAELRTRWPWLAAALSVAVFLPCLLWNASHGWVSMGFQLRHGFRAASESGTFVAFLGGQLAAAGPVVLAAGILFLARARSSPARRVAAATLVPLLVFGAMALRGKVEANWPTHLYPALAAAAAAALLRLAPPWRTRLAWAQAGLGAALLVLFALEVREPRLLRGEATVLRFHGGREMTLRAREEIESLCRSQGGQPGCAGEVRIVAASYQVAAELAYHGGFRRFGPTPWRPSQLDLWSRAPEPGVPSVSAVVSWTPPEGPGAWRTIEVRYRGVLVRSLFLAPLPPEVAQGRDRGRAGSP